MRDHRAGILLGSVQRNIPSIARQAVSAEEGPRAIARIDKALAMPRQRRGERIPFVKATFAVYRAKSIPSAKLCHAPTGKCNFLDLAKPIPVGDTAISDDFTVYDPRTSQVRVSLIVAPVAVVKRLVLVEAVIADTMIADDLAIIFVIVVDGLSDKPENSNTGNGCRDVFSIRCGRGRCKCKTASCGCCQCETKKPVHVVYPFQRAVWVLAARTALDGMNMGLSLIHI